MAISNENKIIMDVDTIEDAGFDQFLSSTPIQGQDVDARAESARQLVGGTFGNKTIIDIGSDRFRISAPEQRMTVKQDYHTRIHFGKRPDGTFGIDVSDVGYDVDRAYEGELLLSTKDRDDWTEYNPANFSYTSASRIAVANYDATKLFQRGDRIKFIQASGTKYMAIYNVNAAYIDVTGGTDYVVANETVTSFYTSREIKPSGYPSTFAFAPALASEPNPASISTIVYGIQEFWITGDRVDCDVQATFTIGTAVAEDVLITLPIKAYDYTAAPASWQAGYGEGATEGVFYIATVWFPNGTTNNLTTAGVTMLPDATPFAISASNYISVHLSYKMAA